MFRPSPNRVRFALVGLFTLLAIGFSLATSQAQFGRPPGFGGGARPPAMGGAHGGFGVMTGPHMRPPGGVPGGGFPGTGGVPGRFGSGFGGGKSETVWRCTACNGELGRGPVDPGQSVCPHCGAHLSGPAGPGVFGADPGTPWNMPATLSPGDTSPGVGPAATDAPAPSTPAAGFIPFLGSGSADNSSASASSNSSGGAGRALKIVGITVGVVFLVGVVGMLVMVAKNTSGNRPRRARRRRQVAFDFDDE
jgi:hypothetical protein